MTFQRRRNTLIVILISILGIIFKVKGQEDSTTNLITHSKAYYVQKVLASDREAGAKFGNSIATSGKYAVVGSYEKQEIVNGDTLPGAGAAYLIERKLDNSWEQVEKLLPSDLQQGDIFGYSVSISGEYALVGAPAEIRNEKAIPDRVGGAYVFMQQANGSWKEVQKLTSHDPVLQDLFGSSVSIYGKYAIVGAPRDDKDGLYYDDSGAAYLFEQQTDGSWKEIQKLTPSERKTKTQFGSEVLIYENRIFVGVPAEATVYLFEKQLNGLWKEVNKIIALDNSTGGSFGASLSMSNNYLAVGAPGKSAAYIFKLENDGSWQQEQKLVRADNQNSQSFGNEVAISGDYMVVGVPFDHDGAVPDSYLYHAGSAYLYAKHTDGNWQLIEKLESPDRQENERYGNAVAASDNYILIGAYLDTQDLRGTDELPFAGSLFVFNATEKEQPDLIVKQKDQVLRSEITYSFKSVFIGYSSDTIAFILKNRGNKVLYFSDSIPVTITGTQAEDYFLDIRNLVDSLSPGDSTILSVAFAPSYLGERTAQLQIQSNDPYDWSYKIKLVGEGINPFISGSRFQKVVSSDREADAKMGRSTAIFGSFAIVGAPYEDKDSVGLNALTDAGAAYIYKLQSDGSWKEAQKLVANDRSAGNLFGIAVSISENYLIVGASNQNTNAVLEDTLSQAGAVYIFKYGPDGVWRQVQKIVPSDRLAGDLFGEHIALSDNYLIVGAYGRNATSPEGNVLNRNGTAYIFERSASGIWHELQTLTNAEQKRNAHFGKSVAISGDYAIVGAIGESGELNEPNYFGDTIVTHAGAAFIFERQLDGSWQRVQKLYGSDPELYGYFGAATAIHGNYALIGAPEQTTESGAGTRENYSGAAYLFERLTDGTWVQKQKLLASDRALTDKFGGSVSLYGSYAVIGAANEDEDTKGGNTLTDAGSAYLFQKQEDGIWKEVEKITPEERSAGDKFGTAVSLSDEYGVITLLQDDENEYGADYLSNAGSAIIFKIDPEERKPIANIYIDNVLYSSGSSYDFDSVFVGEKSAAITFNIENTGNASLILFEQENIVIDSTYATDFVIDRSKLTKIIAPETSTSFTVRFIPSDSGTRIGLLKIKALNHDPITIKMIGSGVKLNNINEAPTARSNTVHPNQGSTWSFSTADFNYTDVDGDTLHHVRITEIPAQGTLWLDTNGNNEQDDAEPELTGRAIVNKINLDAGKLKYFTSTSQASSFIFDVNDGIKYSARTYTMNLLVNEQPRASITAIESSPTNKNPLSIDITFSEAVYNFQASNLIIGNGTASNLQSVDSITFSADITPNSDGVVTIEVPGGSARDVLGASNQASTAFSYTFDGTAPTTQISSSESNTTHNSSFTIAIVFSESVKNFTIENIQVENATVADLVTLDSVNFSVHVLPISSGTVNMQVPTGVAQDLAGNNNEASRVFSILYEDDNPATDTLFTLALEIVASKQAAVPTFAATLYQKINNQYKSVSVQEISDNTSLYFDGLPAGEYTVGIQSTDTSFLPAYLGNKLILLDAKTIMLTQDTLQYISLFNKPTYQSSGESVITGVLLRSAEISNGRILTGSTTNTGEPVVAAAVYLMHPETGDILAYATTDEQGRFSFTGLQAGAYLFVADCEGLPGDEEQNLIHVSTNFETVTITAIAGDNVRVMEVQTEVQVTTVEEAIAQQAIQYYPNPVVDEVFIDLPVFWIHGEISIRDAAGKIMKTQRITSKITKINMVNMSSGIYIILLSKGDNHHTFKVFKQ